jgi:dihydrodipicolinate synthase/N-acetylneuraminate lyase
MGNVFPRATARVYDLWVAGRKEEAKALQDVVANAEWACKKSLALTKFAAGHFLGKQIGAQAEAFWPRKPYLPPTAKMQDWTVEVMGVLEDAENEIPLLETQS